MRHFIQWLVLLISTILCGLSLIPTYSYLGAIGLIGIVTILALDELDIKI